jgi:DNA polymerase III subunit gamma/tau
MALYRKYRPTDFTSLIGQEHIKVTLLNAIKAGKIAHAYLFTGPRGTGKTTTARLLAKAINVDTMTVDGAFGDSEMAAEIDSGRLIDVIEIDAASNRGIDEIRDLREKINYAPTRAKNKVYIIDEVHMLTKEAFNALLKTLEEPPSFVFFILATTEINKVPETIISRCQRFDFRRVSDEVLVEHLKLVAEKEEIEAEEEALKILAKHARGGVRDALTLLEQINTDNKLETSRVKEVLGISNLAACESLVEKLSSGNAAEAVKELEEIFQAGVDLLQFNRDFLDYLRQKMLSAVRADENDRARSLIELIGFFQESYEKQRYSYIPELPLEVAIVRTCLGNIKVGAQNTAEAPKNEQQKGKVAPEVPELQQIITKPAKTDSGIKEIHEGASMSPEITSNSSADSAPAAATAPSLKIDGDLESMLKNWTDITSRVHHPLAKRCLSAGTPIELSGNNLTLAFASNFNKDKLFVPELLSVVEKTLSDACQKNIKLFGKVDASLVRVPVSAPSASMGASDISSSQDATPAGQPGENPDLLSSALDMFGGEVVEGK